MELPIGTVVLLVLALIVFTGLSFFAIKALSGGSEELWSWADYAKTESGKMTARNVIYLGPAGTTGTTANVQETQTVISNIYGGSHTTKLSGFQAALLVDSDWTSEPVHATLYQGVETDLDLDGDGINEIIARADDITDDSAKLTVKAVYPTEPCKSNAYRCIKRTGFRSYASDCYHYCYDLGLEDVDSYMVDCDSAVGVEACCSCEGFPLATTTTTTTTTIPTTPTTIVEKQYESGYWEIHVKIPKTVSDWPDTGMSYTSNDPNSWWMVKPLYDYELAYPDLASYWGDYEHKYMTFQLHAKYTNGEWLIDMNMNGMSIGTDNEFLKVNDIWYQQVLDICPHPFYMMDQEWRWKMHDGETYSTKPYVYHTDLLNSNGLGYRWPGGFIDTKHSPSNALPDTLDIERIELTVNGEDWTIRIYPKDNSFDSSGIVRDNWVSTEVTTTTQPPCGDGECSREELDSGSCCDDCGCGSSSGEVCVENVCQSLYPAASAPDISLKWERKYDLGQMESTPDLVDRNGDGDLDTIIEVVELQQSIRAFDAQTGDQVWTRPLGAAYNVGEYGVAADDIDRDGDVEIAHVDYGNQVSELLALESATGNTIWSSGESPITRLYFRPSIGDVDGDGYDEIAVGSSSRSATDPEGNSLLVFEHDGALKYELQLDSHLGNAPTIVDVDGDGDLDIVAATGGTSQANARFDFSVYAIEGSTGQILWRNNFGSKYRITGFRRSPAVADVDGDGVKEIFVFGYEYVSPTVYRGGLYCLNGQTGEIEWSKVERYAGSYSSPMVADFNDDGHLEILSIQGRELKMYDRHGNMLWRVTSPAVIYSTPAIADLNNDGRLDIICGGSHTRSLLVFDGATGRRIWDFDLTDYGEMKGVATGDIDNDGLLELVFVDSAGYIRVFDTEASADAGECPTEQCNPQRTGLFP